MAYTRFKALILDHDDTTVDSSPAVHYPALMDTVAQLRPEYKISYHRFMDYCFELGFNDYCRKILGFSGEEMEFELKNWQKFSSGVIPSAYEGMARIIARQKEAGGVVCVVSHSHENYILRDWRTNFGCLPDAVYSWDMGEEWRKPSTKPLEDISKKFGIDFSDMIMVDDLKAGYDMARAAGVTFAAAGWGQPTEKVRAFMRSNCDHYFDTATELEEYLFNE